MKNKKIMMLATTDNMIWQFLIPHIHHLQALGNTVECVCARTGFWFEELETKYNLTMHEIDFARNPITPKNLKSYKSLVKLQKECNFDLVYCQQPVGGLMGRLIGKKFKIPVIYTAHGFHFYNGCPLKNKLIYKTVEKWLSKYTDALITINDEDYQNALKFKAKSVYKINGIGIDLKKFSPEKAMSKAEARKMLGLKSDDFVVLSIGELNENKNTYRLLESIKNIDNEKIKYVICGQGPLKEKYENYIKANSLEGRVFMLGFRKDIPDIVSASDLYIMPSYREGLGMATLESMSFGLPAIVSDTRGCRDLVGDNEGGILCNPNETEDFTNGILKLYADKQFYAECSKRNKEHVKQFDVKYVKKQLEEIYKNF